ncbi:MAG: exonuclease domain-containing protein [Eubacterium sp.]|nr:exonuclease domain-containing protein [Eubacterium sp.]
MGETQSKAAHSSRSSHRGRRRGRSREKDKYLAFFDAEYTCYMDSDRGFDRRHSSEVISVGLVITDRHFNVAATYYSPIRPHYNPRLTGYCKSLTGLTQREIDEAPDYEQVFTRMTEIFQDYPVREILVWGNDHKTLEDDAMRNHRSISKRHRKIINQVSDLTRRLTSRVFGTGTTVSLADMKYICDMDHYTAHNAFEDAMDLYQVTKCCMQDTYNKEKAKKLFDYIHDRNTYHQYRRFKYPDKKIDIISDKKLKKISQDYIGILKATYGGSDQKVPPEILAICDDVRSLAAMGSVDLPKLDE